MDTQRRPASTTTGEGEGSPARPASPEEPDRAAVAEAVADAADWRRLVVRHREYAVRSSHRPYRRSIWP